MTLYHQISSIYGEVISAIACSFTVNKLLISCPCLSTRSSPGMVESQKCSKPPIVGSYLLWLTILDGYNPYILMVITDNPYNALCNPTPLGARCDVGRVQPLQWRLQGFFQVITMPQQGTAKRPSQPGEPVTDLPYVKRVVFSKNICQNSDFSKNNSPDFVKDSLLLVLSLVNAPKRLHKSSSSHGWTRNFHICVSTSAYVGCFPPDYLQQDYHYASRNCHA